MPDGYVTSFIQLFECPEQVNSIRVPLIQRDYAQGRSDANAAVIRVSFLGALHKAILEDRPISLDFVYGEIADGRFEPLDGQQRLTTLFLLHWYIASRAGQLAFDARWTKFHYATRLSAERFCELLAAHAYPGEAEVSKWLRDQPWYLHTWNYDPTVQSMLTMLDSIHERFCGADFAQAWVRLTSQTNPVIVFHVLPLESSQGNALYIKMNSRGKPLTSFENFKAHMEQVVAGSSDADRLASNMDVAWPDIFWDPTAANKMVDDQMLRYLEFLMEVLFWRDGKQAIGSAFEQVDKLFNPAAPQASGRLAWLIDATDIWTITPTAHANSVADYFAQYLEHESSDTSDRLPIYRSELDLFGQCSATYSRESKFRKFGWPETLLLYAFIVHRIGKTLDFPRRLRILRNLIEASENELRLELMPGLIGDVEKLVSTPELSEAVVLTTFNSAQRAHERKKIDVVEKEPSLVQAMSQLEDHHLLRGNLFAFDLDCDAATFAARQVMFDRCFNDKTLWPDLASALLAIGNYSRLKGARFYFGSGQETSWREVFTGGNHKDLKETRRILADLLDRLTRSSSDPKAEINNIVAGYLAADPAVGHNWREYMVRYQIMRSSRSGIYVSADRQLGYCLCMLDKTQLNSYYRDAVLSAVAVRAGAPADRIEEWFFGSAQNRRPMRLKKSDMTIECVPKGFRIEPPTDAAQLDAYRQVAARQGVINDSLIIARMPDGITDAADRIELGGQFLAELIAAGL
jgi:hypothetical protein